MIRNCADERELMNMVNELLGIQYNIAKANRTDRKVQNLASYINEDTLKAIHKTMDRIERNEICHKHGKQYY